MFTMNYIFHQHKRHIFIDTIGVILTSYLHDIACDTIDLLAKQTPEFISLTSCPPNIPYLNPVDYDHIVSCFFRAPVCVLPSTLNSDLCLIATVCVVKIGGQSGDLVVT